jgi:hypothetical protein
LAHEVLEKAGRVYDDLSDGVRDLSKEDYVTIIPSELIRPDLKEAFGINKWSTYFIPIIQQCREYEKQFVVELNKTSPVSVARELKLSMTLDQLELAGFNTIPRTYKDQPLVGVIDLLIRNNDSAVILDYKFSTKRKTQDNFDMDSQLYLYACFVSNLYKIPLYNIRVGYIDIPKQDFGKPAILSNGTLSRAKTQNVLPELYKAAVEAIHGNDPYYNCNKGGYYYDTYCALQLNKTAYLTCQYLDIYAYKNIIQDCINTMKYIDGQDDNEQTYLRRYDSYSCKDCEFLPKCKPWIATQGE